MGRPRKGQGITREAILEAALALLGEEGVEAVSFRALATRLGVTAMAVSHHVGSRRDLFAALIAQVFAGVGARVVGDTASDRLSQYMTRYMARALEHPALLQAVLSDTSLIAGELQTLTDHLIAEVHAMGGEGMREVGVLVDHAHGFALSAAAAPGLELSDYRDALGWLIAALERENPA
jgi:AcrR family transcriptional regulator